LEDSNGSNKKKKRRNLKINLRQRGRSRWF
jgi:hypothetical protein